MTPTKVRRPFAIEAKLHNHGPNHDLIHVFHYWTPWGMVRTRAYFRRLGWHTRCFNGLRRTW